MKQLALLWLLCAAAGFTLVAGMAVMLALAFDGGGRPAPTLAAGPASTDRAGPHGAMESLAPIPHWAARRLMR